MMPYDSRPTTSAPLQRPMMAPQYMMNTPYHTAPMQTMPSPQYQPQMPMSFAPYHTPSPDVSQPYKPHYEERPPLRLTPPEPDPAAMAYRRKSLSAQLDGSRSPSVKSESQRSAKLGMSKPAATPKNVTPIIAVGNKRVDFNSGVDILMKTIQAKPETDEIVKEVEEKLKQEYSEEEQMEMQSLEEQPYHTRAGSAPKADKASPAPDATSGGRPRKYPCDFPNCKQSFAQKTHLTIHTRSHTGEQPFVSLQWPDEDFLSSR